MTKRKWAQWREGILAKYSAAWMCSRCGTRGTSDEIDQHVDERNGPPELDNDNFDRSSRRFEEWIEFWRVKPPLDQFCSRAFALPGGEMKGDTALGEASARWARGDVHEHHHHDAYWSGTPGLDTGWSRHVFVGVLHDGYDKDGDARTWVMSRGNGQSYEEALAVADTRAALDVDVARGRIDLIT